jgi:hypothetical protein
MLIKQFDHPSEIVIIDRPGVIVKTREYRVAGRMNTSVPATAWADIVY